MDLSPKQRPIPARRSLLDKAIASIAPGLAVSRLRNRATLALAGAHLGARRDRRATDRLSVFGGSADEDLTYDLEILRSRSRDMVRNQPLALGAINAVATNVVGAGLRPRPQVDRDALRPILGDEQAIDAWEREADRVFAGWADREDCDAGRESTFWELQDVAFRSALESGDCFVLRRQIERGRPLSTALQLIEGDRVASPFGYGGVQKDATDGMQIVQGIKIDANGAPVSVWVLDNHPGARTPGAKTAGRYVDIYGAASGMRQVLHLNRPTRPGQHRTPPYLAPVIESLAQLDRYSESELQAAVVSSLFTVFVESEDGEGLGVTEGAAGGSTDQRSDGDVKLASGAVVELAPGEKVEFANPSRPNAGFDPFFMAMLRQIGAGLDLPLEILVRHFSSSYSASRASLEMAYGFFRVRRAWLQRRLCSPVYEWVISEAVANGQLKAPGFFSDDRLRNAYLGCAWVGPAKMIIDPVKEIDAAEKRILLGIETKSQVTASLTGGDFERNAEQRRREDALLSPPSPPAARPAPPPPDPDDPE